MVCLKMPICNCGGSDSICSTWTVTGVCDLTDMACSFLCVQAMLDNLVRDIAVLANGKS